MQYVWGKILETNLQYFLPLVVFSLCAFLLTVCLVCIVVILYVFVILCVYCCFTLDAGLPARSQYPEGSATSHLDRFFLVSLCL